MKTQEKDIDNELNKKGHKVKIVEEIDKFF